MVHFLINELILHYLFVCVDRNGEIDRLLSLVTVATPVKLSILAQLTMIVFETIGQ